MDQPAQNVPEPTDEEIALSAYRLWLQEGCPHGRDWEHWLKARQQLIAARSEELSKQAGLAVNARSGSPVGRSSR